MQLPAVVCLVKTLLNFYFIEQIVGAFLLYAGVNYLNTDYGNLTHENLWPAVVIFASSGVLIFGSIIGCIGTIIEKKACLGVVSNFLFLLE